MTLPGLGIFKWRNHLENFFPGDCVLAQHFHRSAVSGLFVRLGSARCSRDAALRAGTWAQLRTCYWKPFIIAPSAPWPRETAGPAELQQGHSLIKTSQVWRVCGVRDRKMRRCKQLLKCAVSKAGHTKGDGSWPQWGKSGLSLRMINISWKSAPCRNVWFAFLHQWSLSSEMKSSVVQSSQHYSIEE